VSRLPVQVVYVGPIDLGIQTYIPIVGPCSTQSSTVSKFCGLKQYCSVAARTSAFNSLSRNITKKNFHQGYDIALSLDTILSNTMDQPPVKIGQYILGKNLGIGAFGKVRYTALLTILHTARLGRGKSGIL